MSGSDVAARLSAISVLTSRRSDAARTPPPVPSVALAAIVVLINRVTPSLNSPPPETTAVLPETVLTDISVVEPFARNRPPPLP